MSAISIEEVLKYQLPDKRKLQFPVAGDEGDVSVKEEVLNIKKQKLSVADSSVSNDIDADASETTESYQNKEVEKLLEAVGDEEVEPLDETAVKKMILNFEKRVLKNQEMRIKFPDEPPKFLDSEVELNVAVQELHALATVPHLYHLLKEFNAVQSLLQLLSHQNSDISVAVVDLLQELTDVDTLVESGEGAEVLVSSLIECQLIAVLVQNMERLDEWKRDEADGVHNSLAVVENVLEFRPEVARMAVEQGLLAWLLRRVRQKGSFDGNKLYSSEILAVVLQQSEEGKKALDNQDGIDILLQALASYKRHDPSSVDEMEFMENLFNALCAALMLTENRRRFLDGEGLQLMNLMLREKKQSRSSALKVLNHATGGAEGKENCDKFVEILGLRTLFPLFMKTPSRNKRKGHSAEEHEEHVISIISSLLRNCSDANRSRILNKFSEMDHVKIDRLIELHFRYMDRVKRFEKEQMEAPVSSEQRDEEELYFEKLDAGLFTLQLSDLILGDVCVSGQSSVRERVTKLLSMKGGSLISVKSVLNGYMENLGKEADAEKNRVISLIDKL